MQFLAKCVCAKLSVSYIESNRLTLELFDCCISNKCHRVGCVSVQEARGVFASWELYHLMHKDENVSGFDAAVLIVVTWPVAKNVFMILLHSCCITDADMDVGMVAGRSWMLKSTSCWLLLPCGHKLMWAFASTMYFSGSYIVPLEHHYSPSDSDRALMKSNSEAISLIVTVKHQCCWSVWYVLLSGLCIITFLITRFT